MPGTIPTTLPDDARSDDTRSDDALPNLTPAPSFAFPSFSFEVERPPDLRHWSRIAIASVVAHLFMGVTAVNVLHIQAPTRSGGIRIQVENRPVVVTKLVAPPLSVLTQRAPNRNKPNQEFNVASLPPRPAQPDVPATPGAAATPRQKFQLPDRKRPEAPKAVIEDAPVPPVDTAQFRTNTPPPALANPNQNTVPPPLNQPEKKPEITFEKPGVPTGTPGSAGLGRPPVPRPSNSVDDAARQVARGGGRGLIAGDEEAIPGANPSSPSVPVPGKLGSAVELLSDPEGVDFWPYLVKVLSTVRRNWFSVIPESARFGRQGRTVIQFAISRDGSVPKLVIATPAGAEALDRAAVAAISASNPFVPLPAEYKGSQIRLQFVFRYNVR